MFQRMIDFKRNCTKTHLQVGRAGNTQRPKSVAQWSVVDVQVPQGVIAYRWVEKYSEYNRENCKEMMRLSTSMGEVLILTLHRSGWGGTVGIFITCTVKPSLNRFWKWCTLTIYLSIMSLHWLTFDFYLGQKTLSSPQMYKFPKSSTFDSQEVTGRCLVRMTENSLMRLGIIHPEHRYTWFRAEKVNTHECTIF